jgi:SSS family solute:Na+ symporter
MFNFPELLNVSEKTALVLTIWGIGIIGSIYAVFGGLKAVAVSDSINAIGLMIGGILIPIFGLMAIGDGSVFDGLDALMTTNPERFDSTGEQGQEVPFSTIFTGMMLVQLFYWGTNQQIIQRALAAKNLAEGQKGLLLAAFLKILGPLILVLPGMIAYHYFDGGLASSDLAYPELVRAVLPTYLVGFFAAVLFGAILSSFNSVLNSSVTLFGIDIYKQHINKEAPEKTVVKYGKIFGVCLALAAMFIAPMIANAGSLFNYLQEINGIYSIPILTIIVIGYMTKRVPAIAAKIGIISGSVLYIISQFWLQPRMVNSALEEAQASGITDAAELALVKADAYPHYLHVMAILFAVNMAIMLVIGKFKPRATPYVQEYTEQVEITPYKYVKQAGLIIVLIVVGIYIYFAK